MRDKGAVQRQRDLTANTRKLLFRARVELFNIISDFNVRDETLDELLRDIDGWLKEDGVPFYRGAPVAEACE